MFSSPDLSQRIDLPELMDAVPEYAEYRSLIRNLTVVDRCVLAHRPTFAMLHQVVAKRGRSSEPLHIVDIGCGDGDLLRRVARWAKRRGVNVSLTGVDLNPYAIRAAKEASAEANSKTSFRWIHGDALQVCLPAPVDFVMSCHVAHHLTSEQLVCLLQWMDRSARYGWLINDLHREAIPYLVFGVLGRLMRWPPIILHDGLMSIRRSFRSEDWHTLCTHAGLREGAYRIEQRYPARLCVSSIR